MRYLKNLNYTKSFIFDKAQYVLRDGNGNSILLKVDFKNNKFGYKTKKKNGGGYGVLKKEAEGIAKELLKRKHGKNFADRL